MKKYIKIKALVAALSIMVGAGIVHYYRVPAQAMVISEFQEQRDFDDVHNLFKKDWYWLSARDYSEPHARDMIINGSPNEYESEYFGKMKFSVLRDQGQFVGFTSYYMKNFNHGIVLFLAVEPESRSKGYGALLLNHAIQELFDQGAQKVTLVTRVGNTRARAFYIRSGMSETTVTNGFIGFKIEKGQKKPQIVE